MILKFKYIQYLLLALIIFLAIQIFLKHIDTPYQQFTWQAQSFLQGRLDISTVHDTVFVNGKYYWPQGPFPSLLLMLFQTIFGPFFGQVQMQIILLIVLIFFVYKLARLKGFDFESCIYLTVVFLFGSIAVGLILDPRSWFYAQVVTIVLGLIFLYEFETKRSFLILGLLTAFILATRPTAGLLFLIPLFFLFKEKNIRKKLLLFIYLFTPIFISIFILMWLNFIRFGDFFDNGYLTNNIGEPLNTIRNIGLFSFEHVPTNFYYYFLSSFLPVTQQNIPHLIFPYISYHNWGISFFIISPFLIFYSLKTLRLKDNYINSLWVILIVSLILLLSYYAPGWEQFGPRYTADFLPILYLLTLYGLKPSHLTTTQKGIIMISCFINLYLLLTPFTIYGN